jgi:hypothetical protein
MMHRMLKPLLLVLILSLVGWALHYFNRSEKEQVLVMQQRFITAIEERDWGAVRGMLSSDYADEWGLDATTVDAHLREYFRGFLGLSIESEHEKVQTARGIAMIVTRLKLEGGGIGLSNEIVSYANGLTEPWFFHWHKRGRWPWSWELVQVHNDSVNGLPTL